MLALALPLTGTDADAAVQTVAWYRLGESGAGVDSTGGASPLQVVGSVAAASAVPNSNNTPLAASTVSQLFDGSSGWLATPQGRPATAQVENVGIEAWVNSDDPQRVSIIAHNGMSSGSLGFRGFGLAQHSGVYSGNLAGGITIGNFPVQRGVWTHLALVRQGGVWFFYVNGVLNATADPPATPIAQATDVLSVGASTAPGFQFFAGQIDEVRVFTFEPGDFYLGDLNYFSSAQPPWVRAYNWGSVPSRSPGLRYTQVTITNPRLNVVSVVEVDLRNPDIRFATTPRHPNWGQTMPTYNQYTVRTGRQTTRNYLTSSRAAGLNMVAAINAAPWFPWPELNFFNQSSFQFADRMGLAVNNGVLVSAQTNTPNTSPSLVIHKDWSASMVANKNESVDVSNVLTAVSGSEMLLKNGITSGSGGEDLNPRTAIGLSFDRRKVLLMTVDGRQNNYSLGVGTKEAGELLRHFGAWDGIIMDGGGSTTMALYNAGNDTVALANRPSGSERTNGNNFGVYYISTPEPIAFADWLQHRGVPADRRGPLDDPSGAGVSNLLSYLLNLHPLLGLQAGDVNGRPTHKLYVSDTGERFLEIMFRVNRHATGLAWAIESSPSLRPESWGAPASLQIDAVGLDPITNDSLHRVRIPIEQASEMFARIKAQIASP